MTSISHNTHDERTASAARTGGSTGQKLRGATEVVHGIGENLRGRVMDAVDSTTRSDGPHPETHQGRHEVERGMAKLTGGPGAGAASGAANPSHSTRTAESYSSSTHPSANAPPSSFSQQGSARPTTAPDGTIAQSPYQPQYATDGPQALSGSGPHAHTNDRDFAYGQSSQHESAAMEQQGSAPGSAPDRYAFSGEPRQHA